MKFNLVYVIAMVSGVALTPVAQAGDADAGEQAYLVKGCIGCHGPHGKSSNSEIYPTLAGKDDAYLVEQMKAFRDGSRNNPLMSPMSFGLTDDDIANLAAYLAAQK